MAPSRILYVLTGAQVGGMTTSVLTLLKHLDPKKVQKTLVVLNRGPAAWLFQQQGLPCILLPSRGRQEFLRQLIQRKRIQLVQSCEAAGEGALAAYPAGIPHVWMIGGGAQTTFVARSRRALQAFWGFIGPLSDAVVVPSRAVAREEFPDLPAHKLHVIPLGIETPPPPSQPARGWLKRHLALAPEAPLVAAVGNFYPKKRHEDFLECAALIHQALPEARFLIAGRCAGTSLPWAYRQSIRYRTKIVEAIRRRYLNGAVRLTSYSYPERLSWFRELDLFICASHEGPGQAVLEAMACGVPVIAANVGANSEAIEDGLSGRLVPYRNPDALARAALQILGDPQLAKRLSRGGRRRVQADFSPTRKARSFERLYETLLTKRHAPHTV